MDQAPPAETLKENIYSVLKTIFDPEIPVNIHELGLIYEVRVLEEGHVEIDMTLTSPACPAAQSLPGEVQTEVSKLPGVTDVHVEVVWEPQWNPEMMTEEAKLTLGFM